MDPVSELVLALTGIVELDEKYVGSSVTKKAFFTNAAEVTENNEC
jgi:hypothetical protein